MDMANPNNYETPVDFNESTHIDLVQWKSEIESFIDETSFELSQLANAIENISPALVQQLAENRHANSTSSPKHGNTNDANSDENSAERLASLRDRLAKRLQNKQ